MGTSPDLSFYVDITASAESVLISVTEGNSALPQRTLLAPPNDAWLLAEQAGQLIGLRIQEVAIKARDRARTAAIDKRNKKQAKKKRKATKKR